MMRLTSESLLPTASEMQERAVMYAFLEKELILHLLKSIYSKQRATNCIYYEETLTGWMISPRHSSSRLSRCFQAGVTVMKILQSTFLHSCFGQLERVPEQLAHTSRVMMF